MNNYESAKDARRKTNTVTFGKFVLLFSIPVERPKPVLGLAGACADRVQPRPRTPVEKQVYVAQPPARPKSYEGGASEATHSVSSPQSLYRSCDLIVTGSAIRDP